ncbi:Hypothetical predicted protein [Olea europaea subsp. europaea]|uniref:Uncharacterized protein n=1 Tax=Olea europaea subsp. europaea TaxID=158383 RepID=A0A8S0Q8K3_OLEEU|nr:Hypothetical predicted protein [Olea europaea subsp. europaea]
MGMVAKSSEEKLKGICNKQDRMEHMMGKMKATRELMVLILAQLTGNRADYKEKVVVELNDSEIDDLEIEVTEEVIIGEFSYSKAEMEFLMTNQDHSPFPFVVRAAGVSKSMNELKCDTNKFMDDDSVFRFCSKPAGQENYSTIRKEKHSNFEVLSRKDVDNVPIPSISIKAWFYQIEGSGRNMLIACGVEDEIEEIAPVGEYTLDGKYNFKTIGNDNYEIDMEVISSFQEKIQFRISSISSWFEQASVQDYGKE